MGKLTTKDIAFTVETIAHLNANAAINPYHVDQLLIAAEIVRASSDAQLKAAVTKVVNNG